MNTWIYCGFLGGGMFIISYIFFGSGNFPFLETIKPKIIPESTVNACLFRFTFENIIWASTNDMLMI